MQEMSSFYLNDRVHGTVYIFKANCNNDAIMIVFLEHLSMWEHAQLRWKVQVQKYITHAYETPKTACVQTIMLNHPTV